VDDACSRRSSQRLSPRLRCSLTLGVLAGLLSVFGTGFFDVLSVLLQIRPPWINRMELTVTLGSAVLLCIVHTLRRRSLAVPHPQRYHVVEDMT